MDITHEAITAHPSRAPEFTPVVCLGFVLLCVEFPSGTPKNRLSVSDIIDKALSEVEVYTLYNVDGLIVENMHDNPYQQGAKVGPEVTACMAVICRGIKKAFKSGPVGVNILSGANQKTLSVDKAAGLDFIRAEGFVFSHVAVGGIMNACAGDLLRFRKQIDAENIQVFTDVKIKHSAHAITSDVSIVDTAKTAQYFLSDGVIITGSFTGQAVDLSEFNAVQQNVKIPVLIGSGVTNENMNQYKSANGLIVGSYFKHDGHWENELDTNRLQTFMKTIKSLRENI